MEGEERGGEGKEEMICYAIRGEGRRGGEWRGGEEGRGGGEGRAETR